MITLPSIEIPFGTNATGESTGKALTIGNFDGCHLGHQSLLNQCIEMAKRARLKSLVIAFNPRPVHFFGKVKQIDSIFNIDQKKRAFSELGFNHCVIQTFNDIFAKLTVDEFYTDYLINSLNMKALTVGQNFCFGARKAGNCNWLEKKMSEDSLLFKPQKLASNNQETISSTRIRQLIQCKGGMPSANELLGRPFLLEGFVAKGKQLGRKLGFPTANFDPINQITPFSGTYACKVTINKNHNKKPTVLQMPKDTFLGALSIGSNPTTDSKQSPKISYEVHLIDQKFDYSYLYDKHISVYLLDFIRPERAFESIEKLTTEIKKDIALIKKEHL